MLHISWHVVFVMPMLTQKILHRTLDRMSSFGSHKLRTRKQAESVVNCRWWRSQWLERVSSLFSLKPANRLPFLIQQTNAGMRSDEICKERLRYRGFVQMKCSECCRRGFCNGILLRARCALPGVAFQMRSFGASSVPCDVSVVHMETKDLPCSGAGTDYFCATCFLSSHKFETKGLESIL